MAGGREASLTLGLGEGTGEEAAAKAMVPERGHPGTEGLRVTRHLLPGAKRAAWDLLRGTLQGAWEGGAVRASSRGGDGENCLSGSLP